MKSCCKKHRMHHEVSDPGIPQSNGLAESMVRVEVEGTKCILSHSGHPPIFWPPAVEHFAFSRNIRITNDVSAYDSRHGEGHFQGEQIPFGASLFFVPLPHVKKKKGNAKFSDNCRPGVMMGYVLHPGGKWTGRYLVADLKEYVGMDLRVGKPVRAQEVTDIA